MFGIRSGLTNHRPSSVPQPVHTDVEVSIFVHSLIIRRWLEHACQAALKSGCVVSPSHYCLHNTLRLSFIGQTLLNRGSGIGFILFFTDVIASKGSKFVERSSLGRGRKRWCETGKFKIVSPFRWVDQSGSERWTQNVPNQTGAQSGKSDSFTFHSACGMNNASRGSTAPVQPSGVAEKVTLCFLNIAPCNIFSEAKSTLQI